MTIDSERWDNIDWTRSFLEAMAGQPSKMYPEVATARLPQAVRKMALSLLKHYPEAWWVKWHKAQAKEKGDG